MAVVFAPRGRDAEVAGTLLAEIGIPSNACGNLPALTETLGPDIAFVVLTEESTRDADLRGLASWVTDQPSWSDLPFLVLTPRGGGPERNPTASRLSEILGNVIFVERPFHPTTFVSVARTALRGRLRQYEARRQLDDLSVSEARLRTALTAGRLGTWELNLETLELVSCEIFRICFGRQPDTAFAYVDLVAALHPEDAPGLEDAVQRARSRREDLADEFRLVPRGHLDRWIALQARVLPPRTQSGPTLVGVVADITERKTVEDGLRRLAETLEERIAERTGELEEAHKAVLEEVAQREQAEQQLLQAQKMEMLGQLTGGVAHDFNNLLAAVIGNLELLRPNVAGDERAARLIDGALQGAQRGASLTQRMLAFAKQQELDPKPVDLGELVRGMAELIERSVGGAAEVHYQITEPLPHAMADANQLELALLNLVVNARDAMPDGGVITVRVEGAEVDHTRRLPAGDFVRLIVSDTGTGMDEETLGRAVEPFFSTKEIGKGTGLGLSMIHGLAVQLDGALNLASELGRGTTAELWLRAAAHSAVSPPAEAPADVASAAPKTILLVEDDALIAMSTADLLEDLGHRVIGASRGAEALRILGECSDIDLMITDYSMPGMSGSEVAKAARAVRPDLPILLATGYANLPEGEDLDVPRLHKPYMQHQLAAEIARLVGIASGSGSAG